ncbi:MAG: hypothetical protein ABTD50_21120 [Polyangiaceae bacterium]|jgi:type II secretory pathway component PulC
MTFGELGDPNRGDDKGLWPIGRFMTAVLALALVGCGAAVSPQEVSAKEPVQAPPATAQTPTRPQGHVLMRSAVRAAIARGLGAFLQHVDVEDKPVLAHGQFRGFVIAKLSEPGYWAGVDIKPGDVVISVNGLPIERPEEAQTAFDSLATAAELRVVLEREGQMRELVFPIVDDR